MIYVISLFWDKIFLEMDIYEFEKKYIDKNKLIRKDIFYNIYLCILIYIFKI